MFHYAAKISSSFRSQLHELSAAESLSVYQLILIMFHETGPRFKLCPLKCDSLRFSVQNNVFLNVLNLFKYSAKASFSTLFLDFLKNDYFIILLFVLSRNGDKVKITVESVKDGKTEEVRMIDIQMN